MHTKGPWVAKNVPSAGWEIFAKIPEMEKYKCSDGGYPIWKVPLDNHMTAGEEPQAIIGYEPWIQFPPKWWIEMTAANAQLFSAAPELLEACKEAMAILVQDCPDCPGGCSKCDIGIVKEKLLVVIDKAEGR